MTEVSFWGWLSLLHVFSSVISFWSASCVWVSKSEYLLDCCLKAPLHPGCCWCPFGPAVRRRRRNFFFQPPHWGDVWGWQDFPYLRVKARALTYVWVNNTHSSVSGGPVLAERNKCMEEFVHVCVFTVLMGCCQDLGLGVPSDIHNIIIQQLAASWISLLICFFMQFLFILGFLFFIVNLQLWECYDGCFNSASF